MAPGGPHFGTSGPADASPTIGDLPSAPPAAPAGPPPAVAGMNLTIGAPGGSTPGGNGPTEATGESTAPWAFDPDDDDDDDDVDIPGLGAPPQPAPAPPPPVARTSPSNPFGLEDAPPPSESIVPDSWFAQPRKPPASPGAGAMDRTMMDRGHGVPPQTPGPQGPPPQGPMAGQGAPGYGQGAPMGPAGPGGPGYGSGPEYGHGSEYGPGQAPRRSDGPNKVLIAAASALVTVAIAAVAMLVASGGDDTPSGGGADPAVSPSNKPIAQTESPVSPETKQQAAAMNEVLDASVSTRSVLGGALGRAAKCETLPKAIKGFETVAQRRQHQLQRTRDMDLGQVANGEQLRTSLAEALQASLDVDQKYLQWARTNQPDCDKKPKPPAAQVPGTQQDNRRATNAKQKFVKLWNPVAKQTGLPERSWRKV